MNPHWRDLQVARGAELGPDDRLRFPEDPAGAPADCTLFDLSQLGLIAVRGADAPSFLQGQLTNDIRELSPAHSQLAGWCSAKGRLLASLRVMRIGDAIALQLPASRVAETLDRLRRFVLRAQVELEDAGDRWVCIGLAGDCAPGLLRGLGLALPEGDGDLAETDGVTLLRLPSPGPRFELIGPPERIAGYWDALTPSTRKGSADLWALHDIRAGIPTVYGETADAFVPQMANLQLIDGVSFNKGCYTGQEVVARMQYLGKLKRRMYWAELESDTQPRPGDALYAPASVSEQAAGRVVDARPAGPGRFELLAVAEIAAVDSGEVRLGEGGPLLRLAPPPYGFPPERTDSA
jgi:folate-binding protein YgfZ